jgi:hypothetical protein
MKKRISTLSESYKSYESEALKLIESNDDSSLIIKKLKDRLYMYLAAASEVEHLLGMQYLYCAFSMKKYPEEFSDYDPSKPLERKTYLKRLQQIEAIRRWEAKILYVSRQEMEHLNMVQNLIAILGYDPYMFRPNYPVTREENPLKEPINLMPFSMHCMEVFRYWEKPDHLNLKSPFLGNLPAAIKALFSQTDHKPRSFSEHDAIAKAWKDLVQEMKSGNSDINKHIDSIEELYTFIRVYFQFMLKHKLIEGTNLNRIVEEHFGFNISLDPVVDGKYNQYIDDVINQIMEEGEGVWGVPPPLDSHFMVFQQIMDELSDMEKDDDVPFEPALPVVFNPTISDVQAYHNVVLPKDSGDNQSTSPMYKITNEVSIQAMGLYNEAYNVLIQMLYGFFKFYSIDYTTGIRPPVPNAFFRTSFYPFMTMVMRPLGEMLCRLPADESFVPNGGQVPPRTAGPNFFLNIDQKAGLVAIDDHFGNAMELSYFMDKFKEMSEKAASIGEQCAAKNYHMANYKEPDARDFDTRFQYLSENFFRIGQNFENYWTGKIVAPIPSQNFQNFSDTFN